MATFKIRGTSFCVVYPYRTEQNEKKQQWESYASELEAIQRKAYIDYLQKNGMRKEILAAVIDYKVKHAGDPKKSETITAKAPEDSDEKKSATVADKSANLSKTYRNFAREWLSAHARKKHMKPESYDGYSGCLETHIIPYFGDRIVSTITAEDIDLFIDHLNLKPCKGAKSFHKKPDEVPTLASGSVKKVYNVLMASLRTAKSWGYMRELPETTAPSEKNKKRNAWPPERIMEVLADIQDDKLLHLAVHIAFVCSLRAGEMAGINAKSIDFMDRSLWITQEIQRVSDEALRVIPNHEVIRVFPKIKCDSKSSLILNCPKTEGSVRKLYLTTPLLSEIKERLASIRENQEFFGNEYKDYGLLLCNADGAPLDPNYFGHAFRDRQIGKGIKPNETIDLQGLRKSGQMHKVRLTKNNYQLVAENGGQSPEVLMSNYNEALDTEKRTLALLVETDLYAVDAPPKTKSPENMSADTVDVQAIMESLRKNPGLMGEIMRNIFVEAAVSTQGDLFQGVAGKGEAISTTK